MMNLTAKTIVFSCLCLASPAFSQEEPSATLTATSQSTWLFSWTNRPSAYENPAGHVASGLAFAESCIGKINASVQADSDQMVKGCEGDRMAAGPGIYACDNPFTSHDYGQTLIVMKTKAGNGSVVNDREWRGPAYVMDRSVVGNAKHSAVLYTFRGSDSSYLALAVRKPDLLDLDETYAVKVPSGEPKEFRAHDPFPCTPQSNLKDVLTRWGDQLDFMSLTFNSFHDPSGNNFEKKGELSEEGMIAAIASDLVAVSDDKLKNKIKSLTGMNAELKEALSTSACEEAARTSPRMCLAYEIFDSIVGNEGTFKNPNYSWSYPTLKRRWLNSAY